MKIAMLVNNLEVSGGYQKLVIRLSQELQKKKHEVIIFTPLLDKEACYPNDIKKLKTVTISKDDSDKGPLHSFTVLSEKIPADLDAIIIHDELSLTGIGTMKHLPKKVVWMLNNQLPEDLGKYMTEMRSVYKQTIGTKSSKLRESKKAYYRVKAMHKGLSRTTDFVTYDEFNKKLVRKTLRRKAEVVLAGADLESFKKHSAKRNFKLRKSYTILSVGVIFPHRRYEDLIDAMQILVRKKQPIKLVIVGRQDLSPDYTAKLIQRVKRLKIEKHVTFKNYVTDKEMVELYEQSDAFAFINDGFTWGISVFEAVAAKLPVIITNNIGAADLVKSGETGWVVKPKSPEEVASAITEITTKRSYAEKIASRANETLTPLVTWSAYTDRMLSIIEKK